jgi:acyl carrier protein
MPALASSQADGHADTVQDRVFSEVAVACGLDTGAVQSTLVLRECQPDAFDWRQLWVLLELEFHLSITPADIQRWRTVADIVAYIERRLTPERRMPA